MLAPSDDARRIEDGNACASPSPAELYRLHAAVVYRRCLAMTADRALAEDIMQDVFVRLHEKGTTIEEPAAVLAWLLRVADRLCLDRLRRERSVWRRVRDALLSSPPPPIGPPGEVDPKKLLEEVHQSLGELPVEERLVVVMKYVEGERQVAIAKRLSCSEGRVSKLLSRAIARLRARGWECADG